MAESVDRQSHENSDISAMLFDYSPDGIIFFNEDGSIEDANEAACQIYGYSHEEFLFLSASDIVFGPSRVMFEQFKAELKGKREYLNETVDHTSSGVIFSAEVRGVQAYHGDQRYYIVFIRDITERKRVLEKLEFMAHFDILTGLPNRVYFYNRFAHAIAYAKRDHSKIALLFLDIDGFKEVNDVYGHNIGDMVLQGIADRLMQCVRESDIVARIGGDEMTVVLSKIGARDDAAKVSRKIIELLGRPFEFENISCTVGVSIGIVVYPDDGKETEVLLKKADIAMYKVKESGKNNFCFFS
ncbi:MAG: diguanylate cyclase domain-containing protein [Spirochaetota bacterium]